MIQKNTTDKARFIPRSGYNVVGVDDFEQPGEQLYLVAHFRGKGAAEEALAKFKRENPGSAAYVYGPETK